MQPNAKGETDDHPDCIAQTDGMERRLDRILQQVDQLFVGGTMVPELVMIVASERCIREPEVRVHLVRLTSVASKDNAKWMLGQLIIATEQLSEELKEILKEMGG